MASKRFKLLFLLLSLLCCSAWSAEESFDLKKVEELSKGKYWLRLLHYKPKWPFGKLRSLVDGPEFFFSKDGSWDSKAEMIETIHAFSKNLEVGRFKLPPQCAFPERYRFLKSELQLKIADIPCPRLDEFMDKFKAQSVSLVFSSAHPNNPGSMFGHTFLRIKSNVRPDILDYGISYAAQVADDSNGFEFMILGLAGGYLGQFSMLPYYNKLNEYINAESRDVWEYDLNLNKEETQRMLKHLWEIETNSWFNYFFFDENCAYQLLAAIEIAKPDWDLTDFPIFVIPAETVKRLIDIPGAVTQVKFRPSLRKKLFQKLGAINSEQKSEFFDVIHNKIEASKIQDIGVLETSMNYFQYLKQKEGNKLEETDTKLLRQLMVRRSEMGDEKSKAFDDSLPEIARTTQPELGHQPSRVGISPGILSSAAVGNVPVYFQEVSFKFAYHDLMNNDIGYMPFSHIDFPGITLRYIPKTSQIYLENLTGVATTSLFPLSLVEKRFSWKLLIEMYSPKDTGTLSNYAVHLEAGGGATFNLFTPKAVIYALGIANIEVGDAFTNAFRIGPKIQLATIINPFEIYKLRAAVNLVTDFLQSSRQNHFYEFNLDQSLSLSRYFDIRLQLTYLLNTQPLPFDSYRDGKFTLNYYF